LDIIEEMSISTEVY